MILTLTIILSVVIIAALTAGLLIKSKEAKMLSTQLTATKEDCEKRLADERTHQMEERKRLEESHRQQMDLFRGELENTSHKLLEKQSEQLKVANSEQIGGILQPLREQLKFMKESMDHNNDSATRNASALREAIQIFAQHSQEQDRITQSLTEALKNKGKVQGDWGEQVLEQILLSSHLREGIDFEVQGNVKDEAGNNLRPDVIIHCPDGSNIIIDSKVSLTAYSDYINASTEAERDAASRENLSSISRHITELANKNYNKLVSDAVPTVLMFIPNEGSYILAFDKDPNIGLNAYKKNIVLINPTNLMLTITLIEQMWKNENRDKNVQDILHMATNLYDKFVTFADTFEKVGSQLQTAQGTYDKAIGQLKDGRGNIVSRLEEMKSKGVTTAKQIPNSLTNT